MINKRFVDSLSDLFEGDVIRGVLAIIMVVATIIMAFQGKLEDTFLILTTAVITFYFGIKNGIHQERVSMMQNCPAGLPYVEEFITETEEDENA